MSHLKQTHHKSIEQHSLVQMTGDKLPLSTRPKVGMEDTVCRNFFPIIPFLPQRDQCSAPPGHRPDWHQQAQWKFTWDKLLILDVLTDKSRPGMCSDVWVTLHGWLSTCSPPISVPWISSSSLISSINYSRCYQCSIWQLSQIPCKGSRQATTSVVTVSLVQYLAIRGKKRALANV